jgi:hypothetical protein
MTVNSQPSLKDKLNSIRSLVDADVRDVDITCVIDKGLQLTQMIGLSSECKAEAKKEVENALLAAIIKIENNKYPPSVMLKIANAMCADELDIFEYADRLNAGITHQLDYLRSVISLHKTELDTSTRQI